MTHHTFKASCTRSACGLAAAGRGGCRRTAPAREGSRPLSGLAARRPGWLPVSAALLGLALSACGGDDAAHPEDLLEEVAAATAVLENSAVRDSAAAVAVVRPVTQAELAAQIAAQIESVEVEEGESVRRGQLLVKLDHRQVEASLQEAQAGLRQAIEAEKQAQGEIEAAQAGLEAAGARAELAQAQYQRLQQLLRRNSVSQAEFDQASAQLKSSMAESQRARSGLQAAQAGRMRAQAAIEQARAGVRQAQVTLGYAHVVSPRDGIIIARLSEPGDMAYPGRPLLRLADARSFQALASVSESEVALVEKGLDVAVEIGALGIESEGRVSEIVPQADPASRAFTVKVDLPFRAGLRSGLFARVFFPRPPRQVLLLPPEALVRRGQLEGAFVVQENGIIVFRLVETGRPYPSGPAFQGGLEVLSGLHAGQRVVTNPGPRVRQGVRLAASPPRQEPS